MEKAVKPIVILGIFVVDTTYRAERQPKMGETILGTSFVLGPGGKGSNQAVAAAKAGARTHFITRLGDDAFAQIAHDTWSRAGVMPEVKQDRESYTGAAFVFIENTTGNNAIIVASGAAGRVSAADVDEKAALIGAASIFVTQLEQPLEAAQRGLEIARAAGVTTILNPAPAASLTDDILSLCDYITPNETEAEVLTGVSVTTIDQAQLAAQVLLAKGVGAVVITLGEKGAFYCDPHRSVHVPVMFAGPVVETTGAGDAFNGGFAVALSEGRDVIEAVRFGCATAGISVTRAGAAASMPNRSEIDAVLARN
jgi:ribokinase